MKRQFKVKECYDTGYEVSLKDSRAWFFLKKVTSIVEAIKYIGPGNKVIFLDCNNNRIL